MSLHIAPVASCQTILSNKFDTKELLDSYVSSCVRYHNRMSPDSEMTVSVQYDTDNAKVVEMTWLDGNKSSITNKCTWIK